MNNLHPFRALPPRYRQAFTLVEVLVSMVILAMMMLIITQVISQAQRSWRSASSRVTQFREARIAFDTITRNLRQATLNSYRNFYYTSSGTQVPVNVKEAPDGYARYAELGFRTDNAASIVSNAGGGDSLPGHAVMFQAPLGKSVTLSPTTPQIPKYDQLKSLLCIRGYFVRYSSDSAYVPAGLRGRLEEKYRYRLYEYRPPSEVNAAYSQAATGSPDGAWTNLNAATNASYIAPVAENIVLLILAPSFTDQAATGAANKISSLERGTLYSYNSFVGSSGGSVAVEQHRLPRAVQVTLVAVDEESAKRLAEQNGGSSPNLLGKAGVTFSNPVSYDQDMNSLKQALTEMRMNYRVFSSTVFIPGADI